MEHLLAIYEWIARDSPLYALQIMDNLTKRSQQMSDFPFSGRMVPEFEVQDLREVIEGAYRIIYRVTADQIDVLAVVHGTQAPLLGE